MADGHSPLSQFEVKPIIPLSLGDLDVSFTNSSLFMLIASAAISLFFISSLSGRALVPTRFQALAEILFEFVGDMLKSTVGNEGRRYFPLIFTLFMFILMCNLLGMMPYSFTVTSHIIVTFALAIGIFLLCTIVAIYRQGLSFFAHFLPAGTPWWMAPLMIVIEIFAYCVRPVSLSVRLAANMMAGHVLLKVIAGFITSLGLTLGWLPLAFVVGLTGFEVFIAMLQAYIFTILTCVYLNDAVHSH